MHMQIPRVCRGVTSRQKNIPQFTRCIYALYVIGYDMQNVYNKTASIKHKRFILNKRQTRIHGANCHHTQHVHPDSSIK